MISNCGRVKPQPHSPKYFPAVRENGRCYVELEGVELKQVATLMLTAFERSSQGDETCDHVNRDTADNRLNNLRWATKAEQAAKTGERSERATYHQYEIRRIGGEEWSTMTALEANRKLGLDSSGLSHVANPKTSRTKLKGKDGAWYQAKYAMEQEDEDLVGEEWKDIVEEDWKPGGKYACV